MCKVVDLDSVLRLHTQTIQIAGGAPGIRDLNALRAALARPDAGFGETVLFPTLFLKTAALGHGIATAHPFVDGNKRTALLAAAATMHLNGYVLEAPAAEQEETMVALALKTMSLEHFAQWLEDHAEPLTP